MLRLLIKLYESVPEPDWVSIAQCLMFLDDAAEVAKILHKLLKGSEVRQHNLHSQVSYLAIKGNHHFHILHILSSGAVYHAQEDAMLAYQVCFNLFENEMQAFLLKVSMPACNQMLQSMKRSLKSHELSAE